MVLKQEAKLIQDILPSHLNNQYKNVKCEDEDIIFYFQGSTVLAKKTDDIISYPSYREFVTAVEEKTELKVSEAYTVTYLLSVDKTRYFLAMRKKQVLHGSFEGETSDSKIHNEYRVLLNGYEFIGVNMFRNAKPKAVAFAAITAFHLYGWYRDNQVCGRCGHIMKHDDKQRMLYCTECGNVDFPKICPAVIVGVTNADKILMTKYAGRNYKNYALIAGFNEIGETIEQTVEREVMEEVGLRVKNLKYYKSQPWGLSGSLLMGFFCELDGDDDTIKLDENELAVGGWFAAKDIDLLEDGVSLTREMILKFKETNS